MALDAPGDFATLKEANDDPARALALSLTP
jgi:hypothetical protein